VPSITVPPEKMMSYKEIFAPSNASTKSLFDRHIFTNRGARDQRTLHKVCALTQPRRLSKPALAQTLRSDDSLR
jgi:hypothetical protein